MRPKTLLEMAGVAAAPPRLGEAVVVVIDAQREYLDGFLVLPAVQPALAEIGRLLARARALRTPIIHVVHHGKTGGAFAPGSPGAEIAAPAAPAPGEAVLAKGLKMDAAKCHFQYKITIPPLFQRMRKCRPTSAWR